MITSAEEFVRLRTSNNPHEYLRAAHEEASDEIWHSVLSHFPDMAFWVAQNKTISHDVILHLASHPDSRVRGMIARKRKTPASLLEHLSSDVDESVRLAVAYNAKVGASVLEKLACDSCESIQEVSREKLSRINKVD